MRTLGAVLGDLREHLAAQPLPPALQASVRAAWQAAVPAAPPVVPARPAGTPGAADRRTDGVGPASVAAAGGGPGGLRRRGFRGPWGAWSAWGAWGAWGKAGAVLLAAALAMHAPRPPFVSGAAAPGGPAAAGPDDPRGPGTAFLPLGPSERWAPAEGAARTAWLLPTELPRDRLALLGLPYDPARAGERVRAELLVDAQGEVLAVRVLD
ncbi:hypothetical protein ISF6_2544 [Piscinibacter sakaiensis]|uniref:Uncharacterized protein n=1 Tax=Piscinibacter sakaiensis TaxID=1547922 RepID=A0A0K8P2E8_PISS1|nr:hypothetical protein ISF6_2544 [Piscinibacter sakaiensis]